MNAYIASWYVLGMLFVFIILEVFYTRWAKKALPSWTRIPFIGSFAMIAGFWVHAQDWSRVVFYLALSAFMTYRYIQMRKREQNKDTSWKEMFR